MQQVDDMHTATAGACDDDVLMVQPAQCLHLCVTGDKNSAGDAQHSGYSSRVRRSTSATENTTGWVEASEAKE
jgi:hypothetical protein